MMCTPTAAGSSGGENDAHGSVNVCIFDPTAARSSAERVAADLNNLMQVRFGA